MNFYKRLCLDSEKEHDHTPLLMTCGDFNKIRAVVEAAKQISDSHEGQDDTAELGYLNITLRELGVEVMKND